MTKDKLIIFDTTLRDGEQSPGASMNEKQKLEVASILDELNVDVIEAGFAISSKGDFKAIQKIAKTVKNSTVCSLSRALKSDIDAAFDAIKHAKSYRIHTFIATSPIHMQYKLKMHPEKVIEKAVAAVTLSRNYTDNVEFSCEDAGRSEIDFLAKISEAVIKAGATTINLPDTVGYRMPEEYGDLIKSVIEKTPNSEKAIFSTHCHNDLGLAVANSLSGVKNGARQIECTINGIGERAGNAALEEIVMAVKTRTDYFNCETNINTKNLLKASNLLANTINFPVQPNKAIVGQNAFSHESGIHQDGVIKHRETYEIMKAEDIGWTNNQIVLGKLSGQNAFKTHLSKLGIEFKSKEHLDIAFKKFKDIADKNKSINDEQLMELVKKTKFI